MSNVSVSQRNRRIRRALVSVSNKHGLDALAAALARHDVEVLSTGGTAKALRQAGARVVEVADYTGAPEILDGRVKTLHPKIHGGLLGRPTEAHQAEMARHGIENIDLVVVNLYPFRETVAKPGVLFGDAIENIDIGGPSMIRSAAKNHERVAVVVDPEDYAALVAELDAQGGSVSQALRWRLARKAFAHTAAYDGAIANFLTALPDEQPDHDAPIEPAPFPGTLTLQFVAGTTLRYGENPHQSAAFYRDPQPAPGTLATFRQLQGKELSYNNLGDADAAWECVRAFDEPACVIVKHANPCGVAVCPDGVGRAYERAYQTDPTSAFGGIIAFNRALDGATAHAIVSRQFVEVVMAPAYDAEALAALAKKANVRVLEIPLPTDGALPAHPGNDCKRVGSGLLVQSADHGVVRAADLKVVTRRAPTPAEIDDLLFAWRVAKYVKSNAIVYARERQTIGIGAGQMSRVYSAKIAGIKAADEKLEVRGSVMASDAFFPFRDGIDAAAAAGIVAVIEPGGSVRDEEVIAAADEHGMAMVFTGMRHFRH